MSPMLSNRMKSLSRGFGGCRPPKLRAIFENGRKKRPFFGLKIQKNYNNCHMSQSFITPYPLPPLKLSQRIYTNPRRSWFWPLIPWKSGNSLKSCIPAIEVEIREEAKKNFPEGWGAYFALEMTLFYHLTLKWKSYDLLPSKPAAVASQVRRAASAAKRTTIFSKL